MNKWMAEVRNKTTNQVLRTYHGDSVLQQLKARVEEAEGELSPAFVIEYKLWSKETSAN